MLLYSILLVIQVLLSIGLITLVLLQHGKGADAGATFGSGASSTVFGSRGSANFFSRSTAIVAGLFFVNCIALAYITSHEPTSQISVVDRLGSEQIQTGQTSGQAPAGTPAVSGEGQPADVPGSGTGQTSDVPE